MKLVLIIYLAIFPTLHAGEKDSSERLAVNGKVAAVMGMMHLPSMGVSQLTGQGDFSSKYFKQAAGEFINQAQKMAKIEHPDKSFRTFNEQMLKALKPFDTAVKSASSEGIKKSWAKIMMTCSQCHAVYHTKKK